MMAAAENDAIHAKIGGFADVVRDVPPALVRIPGLDCRVSTLLPSHGYLHQGEGSREIATFPFAFAGSLRRATLYEIPALPDLRHPKISHFVIDSELFRTIDPVTQQPVIYCDDPSSRPFATDATKYASFCAAAAQALNTGCLGKFDCLHLHEWHTAFLLILRRFDKSLTALRAARVAFTIHNLVIQGMRPLRGDSSSLEAWYPNLAYDEASLRDPEYRSCVNPMAVGIRFADAVHVVSPSYAEEVLKPSRPSRNHAHCYFYGGEGLESDLRHARSQNRLFGILNGCEYGRDDEIPPRDHRTYMEMLVTLKTFVQESCGERLTEFEQLALERLEGLLNADQRPRVVMTSVTRVVDQKVKLMCPLAPDGDDIGPQPSALQRILEALAGNGVYIVLGAGDHHREQELLDLSRRLSNFAFVHGYSDQCAAALYEAGDIFLMPSTFEPCGISQMLAMKAGQPCVVHERGGLRDTVSHGVSGFSFDGETEQEQADQFVETTVQAARLKLEHPARFDKICTTAAAKRFLWKDSARRYATNLYGWSIVASEKS